MQTGAFAGHVRRALALHEVAGLALEESTGDYHLSASYLQASGYADALNEEIRKSSLHVIAGEGNGIKLRDGLYIASEAGDCGMRVVNGENSLEAGDVAYEGMPCYAGRPFHLTQVSPQLYVSESIQTVSDTSKVPACNFRFPDHNCKIAPFFYDHVTGKYLPQKGDKVRLSYSAKVISQYQMIWMIGTDLMKNGVVVATGLTRSEPFFLQHEANRGTASGAAP